MRKAYYLSTPHLAPSRTPKTFISVFVRAYLCACQNEGECMRERERGRGNSRVVDS